MELRLNERHLLALNFLLIAALAYFGALAVNDLIARGLSPSSAQSGSAALAAPADSRNHPRHYYQQIVERDIFNLVPQVEIEQVATAEDLGVKLLGTSQLTFTKPFAIIEDHSGAQSLYQLGEDVPDAGRLVSVEKNRVLIDHGGRLLALEIPNASIGAPEPEPARRGRGAIPRLPRSFNRPRPADFRKMLPLSPGVDDKINIQKLGPNRFSINKDELRHKMQDPGTLMTDMRAVPIVENGQPNGYTLSEIEPSSPFAQVGLHNGDVVTQINGKPLGNPLQAFSQLGTIAEQPGVDVTVMRNKAPVKIHFDLR